MAGAREVEDHDVVKDPAHRAPEGVVLREAPPPELRLLVAGEDDIEVPIFVVPPVYHVEEQPGVLRVEVAVADLVDDEARGLDEGADGPVLAAVFSGLGQDVVQLRHLDEVRLHHPPAAFVAECHREMCLPRTGRPDEGGVPMGVERCERRYGPEPVEAVPGELAEVEVLERPQVPYGEP